MLVLLGLLLHALLSQSPAPGAFPGAGFMNETRAGHYLAALLSIEAECQGGGPASEILQDTLGIGWSFVGDEERTLEVFDAMGSERHAALERSPLDEAQALDAIPAIVEAARGRRIVILNESHHMPRHRAFALELARALRAEGFDTFAAEAFADAEATAARGYPAADTGYYTMEPVFGGLVRGAIDLGYRLVAYEPVASHDPGRSQLESIRLRETGQARNLVERVFEARPDARLFVHVGYSHATEDWIDPGGPNERAWMAARLGDLTGFDPLTIDQTTATPRSDPAFADPHWRRAAERGVLSGPKVFRLADGTPFVTGKYAGKVDLQVFHPPSRLEHGRPDWLARGRTALAVPEPLRAAAPAGERVLLQAFRADEGPDAIPADQMLLEPDAPAPVFLLPRGTYRLAVQDASGRRLASLESVTVD